MRQVRQLGSDTHTRRQTSALTGEGAELEVPENVRADLRKRAEQEGGPVSSRPRLCVSRMTS